VPDELIKVSQGNSGSLILPASTMCLISGNMNHIGSQFMSASQVVAGSRTPNLDWHMLLDRDLLEARMCNIRGIMRHILDRGLRYTKFHTVTSDRLFGAP
jgi:hypothetical protein